MKGPTVFGTHPEAIKMAPVIKAPLAAAPNFDTKVCVTAQHRQTLDQMVEIFDIQPDFDLNWMKPEQDLSNITINVPLGMREVYKEWHPMPSSCTMTPPLAASLSAYYAKVKSGHVEAGLRTHNKYTP